VIAALANRFRRSLTLKLLVPALAVGALAALAGGWLLYSQFKAHARAEMTRWAVSLADSVNYAAETSDDAADLERFVTALGAEPDIRTIVVAAGQPPQVLASTHMAWWRHSVAEVPDGAVRRRLQEADGSGPQAHWSEGPARLITTVPLRIHRPEMDPARLAAGTVYLELDARAELAHQRFHATLAGGVLGGTALLITVLGLWLIQSRVTRPVRAIQAAVERRQEGDDDAYAPVTAGDEIGLLARATNRLLDLQAEREALFRQMFSDHPSVQFLLDADDGSIVDLNNAAEGFYGYPRRDLLGQPISRINNLTPAELEQALDHVRSEGALEGQFQHRLANGELREVWIQTGLVRVGERTYLNSIVHDVTEANRYRRQLETYRHLFQNLPVGVFRSSTGAEGRFLELNPAMGEMFGAESTDELARHSVVSLYRDSADRETILSALQEQGEVRRREVTMQGLDGTEMWVSMTAYLLTDEFGTTFVDGILEDITERKSAEQALRQTERRLRSLLEHFPGAVLFEDSDRQVVLVNRNFVDLFQVPAEPEALVGSDCKTAAQAAKGLFTRPEQFIESIEQRIREQKPAHGEQLAMTDGRTLERDYLPIPGDGALLGHMWLYRDITGRKTLEAELQHQATHDRLTGTRNRLRLEELLEREQNRSERYGTPFALVMFDIDHFKRVNDTYGHDTGDAILRELTRLVEGCLRPPDTLARWGGEEFMVMLPETDRDGATELAQRLRRAVAEHTFSGPGEVTISLGVAEHHADQPVKVTLKAVDDALYRAKGAGRNRVEVAGA
jgi:diguanylate cyclase (GGDEF)-like protein/PAS domain S-box-containing protein